jgi:protein-L-isoaspartate(D-aspartate) O-methyltransferase
MTPWSDVYLWLAGFEPGFCRLDQAGDPQLAGSGPVMKTGWYPFAIARDGTLSYLAAATLIRHLHAWDARSRDLPEDCFAFWPDGASPARRAGWRQPSASATEP